MRDTRTRSARGRAAGDGLKERNGVSDCATINILMKLIGNRNQRVGGAKGGAGGCRVVRCILFTYDLRCKKIIGE
ncbi:hypothetical protein EVAR_43221_1 [Eumeta japonica]|uniref:Uncharacterized protein n=1 Tax=Eumeta variegata TaxID=151549 RepID=A0A4C1WRT2_EUMVA|nr:hypothetical protein EVAR_43221_1 [Eumeta japonica]